MKVVALAGGVGAGKFLRGLVRAAPDADLTAVVNTGDDIDVHGLRVCPDLDSVTYWLGDAFDRERGWGRRDETFRAIEELRTFDPDAAWFGLGDLDLATHLFRTRSLAGGMSLSGVTARIAQRFGIDATIVPMTEDRVETRLDVVAEGREMDLHFQEYWVRRGARDDVKAIRFEGAERASPAPGVLDAIGTADVVVICPSNPVVSIGPILSVPGVRAAVAARPVVGVSPIVGGRPLAGMADRLMPVVGLEVSAVGAAHAYDDLLDAWVIDGEDAGLRTRVRDEVGARVAVTDTVMRDDAVAEHVARTALATLDMTIELIPLEGLPEVEPGDDLASLLEPSLLRHGASEGDVVAITQKVVSKAEGRIVPGDDRASWVARESVAVVARRGDLLITRTKHGLVCANAGVDASNVAPGFLTLLPEDPDASAERLQKELVARLGLARLGCGGHRHVRPTLARGGRRRRDRLRRHAGGARSPRDRRRPWHGAGDHDRGARRRGGGGERLGDDEDGAGPIGARPGTGSGDRGCAAGSRARPRPRTRRRPVPGIRRGGPRLRRSEQRVRLRRRAARPSSKTRWRRRARPSVRPCAPSSRWTRPPGGAGCSPSWRTPTMPSGRPPS